MRPVLVSWSQAVVGAVVGVVVGLTGAGGGALLTPLLILGFGVAPSTAVSSDLLVSLVMRPVGGMVHVRRGTVAWGLVGWLCVGSVPAGFASSLLLGALGHGAALEHAVQIAVGVALAVAAVATVAKSAAGSRSRPLVVPEPAGVGTRRLATVAVGIAGGVMVGMTSVGSGSLMMVLLMLVQPRLSAKSLVGTDLVQAVPLIAAATLGHALVGHISFDLTLSLVIGSVPGVYVGARLSSRAPDGFVKPALVVVLGATALKLLGAPSPVVVVSACALGSGAVIAARTGRRSPGRVPRRRGGHRALGVGLEHGDESTALPQ